MQKVEGSNPFSRFNANPLHFGRLAIPGENQTTPAYRLHFGHLACADSKMCRHLRLI